MIQIITQDYYEKNITNSPTIHLLLFGSIYCGASEMLLPVLNRLEREYEGKAEIGTVDIDKESELAKMLDVDSTPTVLILKDGKQAGKAIGAKPIAFYRKMIKEADKKG